MSNKEKKVIFTAIAILVAILIIVVIVKGGSKKEEAKLRANTIAEQNQEKYTTTLDDGTKINNSTEFNKTKKYKEMEISNIQFTYQNGKTVLLADVKNTANTKHNSEIVKLTILGENGEVIEEIQPVLPTIEPGATKQINYTISGADSSNARDFRIEAK